MTARKTIPLLIPYIPPGAIENISRTLATRWIGQGPQVEEFERRFSKQLAGGRPAVAVGSCTDALHLAYVLSGIGPGDEVIAPVFTCAATNIPLLYCGATIRFCDVAPNSLHMDPAHAKSLLTDRTKAVVVMHYGGASVDNELFLLGPPVIEDCAQAIGPSWVGTRGAFACFSFQAVKHVTTADGGMLVLPEHLEAEAKRRRWFGIDRGAKVGGAWASDIQEIGYKYQMTDVAAAMGMAGLDTLDGQISHRRLLRETYVRGLNGVSGIRLLDNDPTSACWLCTVLVDRRDDFQQKLAAEGIESDPIHFRNDRYSVFGASLGTFPNMDAMDSKYLALPLHMGINAADVERICAVIRSGW